MRPILQSKNDPIQAEKQKQKLLQLPRILNFAQNATLFKPDIPFTIGDITITPIECDHSAIDSYMFLIQADNKRILHTGDFRTNGFFGEYYMSQLAQKIGRVDAVIMEGTTLYSAMEDSAFFDPDILPAPQAETLHLPHPASERDLQITAKSLFENYTNVFIIASTTALERIFAFAKVVPPHKFFIVDEYQNDLINLVQKYRSDTSDLFNIRPPFIAHRSDISLKPHVLDKLHTQGCIILARNNHFFHKLIDNFKSDNSLFIYSMWDGYRRKRGSHIDKLLQKASLWTQLHTGGHTSMDGLKHLLDTTLPATVVPIHTEHPELLQKIYDPQKIHILQDREIFELI